MDGRVREVEGQVLQEGEGGAECGGEGGGEEGVGV